MSVGTRVVRSKNWTGQQDGGEGHLGTIYQPDNQPTSSDKRHVVWDNGNTTVCKIGVNGDILVYDSAPTGVSHPGVVCDSCLKDDFRGVRWKCNVCPDYDLCNTCYMMQKHEMDHQFQRISHSGGQRVLVGKRHGSVVIQAWGISKGAEVTRGIHWKWGDQDGNTSGVVKSIANWNKTSWRSGARVEWKNGNVKGYRVGFEGAVDLKYIKESRAEPYYRDHLAYVEAIASKDEREKKAEKEPKLPPKLPPKKSAGLLAGDQVTIKKVSTDLFQMMQADYGGFSDDLAKVIGKTGTVKEILEHKGVVYPRITVDGEVYTINPELLEKKQAGDDTDDFLLKISNIKDQNESSSRQTSSVPPTIPTASSNKVAYKVGDKVRLKWIDESKFKELQNGFGNFVSPMLQVRCKTGKIEAMLQGRVPRVRFDATTVWNLNPECLEPANEADDEDDGFVQTISGSRAEKSNPSEPDAPVIKTNKFASGDKVRVRKIEEFQMRDMQKGFSEFNDEMRNVCGKTGTVIGVNDDTKAVAVSLGGRSWNFNPACIVLVEQGPKSKRLHGSLSSSNVTADAGPIRAGDVVKVKDMSLEKFMSLQNGHGGFNLAMTQTIGETGQVLLMDSDGDVQVDFSNYPPFYFNTACLEMVSRGDGRPPSRSQTLEDGLLRLLIDHHSRVSLVAAAANGDLSKVDQYVRQNPSSIDDMEKNVTPLMAASAKGHKVVVERLLQAGANLEKRDKDNWTAVFFAVYENHPTIVEFLLSKGCNANVRSNNGSTCLHLGARKGFDKCVAVLLSSRYKCDPNIKDDDGDTALHEAVSKKHGHITELLVQHPRINMVICNNRGLPPIHLAAAADDVVSIAKMVQQKANLINLKKADGLTALHLAAMNNSTDAVRFFISQSMCNKNMQDDKGSTALHCAVSKGNNTVIELLVKSGANMNVRDNDGDTCLHIALMSSALTSMLPPELLLLGALAGAGGVDNRKGVAIAVFLVVNGADLNIKNHRGRTPLDVAGSPAVRNKLLEAKLKRTLVGGLGLFR